MDKTGSLVFENGSSTVPSDYSAWLPEHRKSQGACKCHSCDPSGPSSRSASPCLSLVQPLPLPPETVPGSNTEQKPPCLCPLMWGRLPWGSGQTSPGCLYPPLPPSSKLPCSCLLLLSTSDSMSTCQPHFTDSCCCSPRRAT